MRILVTQPTGSLREILYPSELCDRLGSLGDVEWNDGDDHFTPSELRERLTGVDVCITGWGCPTLSEDVLADAGSLELVAHVGGSVASVASPALYDRGISVVSANHVMAPFVAEGILAYTLAALRNVPYYDAALADGEWPKNRRRGETLFDATVGFVGLGAVGRELLDLLEPFDVAVRVYDPYVSSDALEEIEFATLSDLDDVLESADVVSIQASLTPETVHLIDADRLATLPEGCLLVNAARGPIVDEDALVTELESGRFQAALDVFNEEPLTEEHPLRDLENAVLGPHVAGSPVRHRMTEAVIDELERYATGESFEHEIFRERYELMTKDWLEAP